MIMDRKQMLSLVEKFLAAWNSQDMDRVLAIYTKDLEYKDPNTAGAVRGRAAMRRYLIKLFSAWRMTWWLREAALLEGGEGCTVLWSATFQRASGGPRVRVDGMDLVELQGDLIYRNEVMFDRTMLSSDLNSEPVKQLLLRGWMTHDAMWFKNALQMVGIETTNELNRRAVRDMAPFEVRRVLKALRMDGVSSFEELRAFMTGAMSLLGGDFMKFRWQWQPPDRLLAQVDECFAYRGVKRIGAIEKYECGIYDRVYGWLDALGIGYQISPDVEHCTMHHEGRCSREIHFSFADRMSACEALQGAG
jgi:ketosteroid isomerase-like protein